MNSEKIFTGLVLFCFSLSLSFCKKTELKKPYEIPIFIQSNEQVIKDNLGFPSGLSKGLKITKSSSKGGDHPNISGVLTDGPLFRNLWANGGIQNYVNPKVYQFSGTFDNISTEFLLDFDLNEYVTDFCDTLYFHSRDYNDLISTSLFALGDSLWRPYGLTLDGLILNDGSILITSSISDKIFKINSGNPEIFLQNTDLKRITGIIQSRDGIIYAAQSPLIKSDQNLIIECPKRVIAIKNNNITLEFELPTTIQNPIWQYNSDNPHLSNFEKIKIIQNSPAGRKRFGINFYISDLFENVIYKVDTLNNVSILASGLDYPTSLAVDSVGDLFYTTTPIANSHSYISSTDISHPASLCAVNPESGETKVILEFGGSNVADYRPTGSWITLDKRGEYFIPVNFNVTNVLYESENKLNFLITNSHQKTLKLITLEKE
jgi:hypothetical protein